MHAVQIDTHPIAQFLCGCGSLAVRSLGKAASLIYKVSKDVHTPTKPLGAASREGHQGFLQGFASPSKDALSHFGCFK